MPDLEAEFRACVRDVVSTCLAKGKNVESWAADTGQQVHGWAVERRDSPHSEQHGNGWWKETWGHGALILGTDGTFWEYSFSGSEQQGSPAVITKSLYPAANARLVGQKGKPFAELKAKVERLPYL